MPRPNVAPRPVCRYYNTSRGCFAGDKCHYLHGDPSVQKYAPYEENKSCRYFSQGFCKRGRECWYKHIEPKAAESSTSVSVQTPPSNTTCTQKDSEQEPLADEDLACGICFEEKPALYGLLSGCSHAFCLPCIRRWRAPEGKGIDLTESGMHKTCPMCRTKSKFVVPSSLFYQQNDPRKSAVIENYKQSMARVPCQYFVKSEPEDRFCPFGKDCFYQHLNEDGTPYIFEEGVDVMMRRRRRNSSASQADTFDVDPLQVALDALEGFVGSLMQNGNANQGHADNVNSETNTEDSDDNDDDSLNNSQIRREVLDLHLSQMMKTMGHASFGSGMTSSSAIDLEALFTESSSPSEDDTEDWDDDEPFVVYTGDLHNDADDEDDGEEEPDSYWDDLPTPTSIAPASYSMPVVEEEEYEYYEAFMDGPELESESETEESELETESEDVVAIISNLSTTPPCIDLSDEQLNASLLGDEVVRLMDRRW